jgi:nitrous oxide reductase accessory protein NosL
VAIDRTPKAIRVGDRATKALIDAEKAIWVIGGDAPGVMTKRAKWAFADRATAEEFVRVHGGTIATFDDAMGEAGEAQGRQGSRAHVAQAGGTHRREAMRLPCG